MSAHLSRRPFVTAQEPFLPYVAPAVTLCFPICQRINSSQVHAFFLLLIGHLFQGLPASPRPSGDFERIRRVRGPGILFLHPDTPISPICRTPLFPTSQKIILLLPSSTCWPSRRSSSISACRRRCLPRTLRSPTCGWAAPS